MEVAEIAAQLEAPLVSYCRGKNIQALQLGRDKTLNFS